MTTLDENQNPHESLLALLTQGEDDTSGLPLSNVLIADFSRLLPGPWSTQLLSDLGATVIKIERPGSGDMSRANAPHFKTRSVYFNSVNGGKHSVTLDLSSSEGRAIAHKLIAQSDVVVESFRPGVAKNLDIDYTKAKELNAGIVYCSITGFGQTGPLSHISGHDLVIQALSGFAGLSAQDDKAPDVPGFQAADYAGATMAVIGILGALIKRKNTGEGSNLDVAMFDSLFAMCNISQTASMARKVGNTGTPAIEVWGGNPRYATYLTADNKAVAVALLEKRLWVNFCTAIDREDLIDHDERLEDRHSDHGGKAAEYRAAIADCCRAKNRDELIDEMTRHGVPMCPIYSPDEALNSENVAGRGLIEHASHPEEGDIPQIVNPLALSGLARRHRPHAPDVGDANNEVLNALGFDADAIENLIKNGVI
ncbi:CaiB/BaiF CoA transferase family protein [Profundibacter sp.]